MSVLSNIVKALAGIVSTLSKILAGVDTLLAGFKMLFANEAALAEEVQVLKGKLDQILDELIVGEAVTARFTVTIDGQINEGATMLQFTTTQQAQLAIQFFDKKGNPATVDGPPVWTSSDDTVASVVLGTLNPDGTIAPDPSGINAVAVAHKTGTAQITNTADADLSPGVRNLINTLDVTVSPAEAVTGNITTAIPVEQP